MNIRASNFSIKQQNPLFLQGVSGVMALGFEPRTACLEGEFSANILV
tara:strand:- start:423 stop:563 length:141 start_codon:yes stop_codon:yes gene_type:complete